MIVIPHSVIVTAIELTPILFTLQKMYGQRRRGTNSL